MEVIGVSKEFLRTAVVGLGKMGWLHASILSALPNVQLAAVCEKSALVRKVSKKIFHDIPVVRDVREFSDLEIDAVYVTTPPSSHFAVAKALYEDKLAQHLFVEKPLASRFSQAKELCELVDLNGGVNMVGYLRRFMVTFIKAKELLMQGAIGEPLSFSLDALSSDFYGLYQKSKFSVARGGVLGDLGSHVVDIMLWFFGNLQLDSAKIDSLNGSGSEDAVRFAVHRESDSLRGGVFVSWCANGYRMPEVILSIIGSKGTIEANDYKTSLSVNSGEKSTWYRHNLDDQVNFWLAAPEYYREDAYFVNAVVNKSAAEPSFKTASNVDFFIETIRQKASKHD
jgi:predicted dehydrogenase